MEEGKSEELRKVEIRTPKVLEKTPEVFGYDLGKVLVGFGCTLGLIFVGFYNIKVGLAFPAFAFIYFYIKIKFPEDGELMQWYNYNTGNRVIRCNYKISEMVVKASSNLEDDEKSEEVKETNKKKSK